MVLLAFGSVEAQRAARSGTGLELSTFRSATEGVLSQVSKRWPDADLVVASVPFANAGVLVPADVEALNEVLSDAAATTGAQFLDLSVLFGDQASATYDGVHVSRSAYAIWERELRNHVARGETDSNRTHP